MRYVSTRGGAPALGFRDAVLAGLARDGGLYVPEAWPALSKREIAGLAGLSYAEAAFRIISRFSGEEVAAPALKRMLSRKACAIRPAFMEFLRVVIICGCPTTSSNLWGLQRLAITV